MSDHASTIASAVQLLNAGDVDGYVTTLYAPEAVFHGFPPAFAPDRDGITGFFRALLAGVPDATISAQDLFADGDRVAVRFTLTGTHAGELFGMHRPGHPSRPRASPSCVSPRTAASSAGTGSTTSRS